MESLNKITVDRLSQLFDENREMMSGDGNPTIAAAREKAMGSFRATGFPSPKEETWRNTDLTETFARDYVYHLTRQDPGDIRSVFRCNIPNFDTAVLGQLNGWTVSRDVPLMLLGNGMIMGSLSEAIRKFPQLVEPHLGKYAAAAKTGFTELNMAFAMDGIFIYVPDNVSGNKAVQMVNVIRHPDNLFLQTRNLIVMGKNSRLTLVHCDDSYNQQASFSNNVTEIFLNEGAEMDHYKLQSLNNSSTLIGSTFFRLEKSASLESHFVSLTGGLLRNDIHVNLAGPHANADIYGLYLMDRKQHIDNHVFVDHAAPHCTSNERFRGILDEHATGVFNGHVLVRPHSVGTSAYQGNKNILLTDTARIHSQPFLEIYNDDVKCSHGSSTGQLDTEAMFYLRQRGIGEENARMLLMYAFADEIVNKIRIGPLRHRFEDMIKRRLQGELQICEQCVLHCSNPEKQIDFKIDPTRI